MPSNSDNRNRDTPHQRERRKALILIGIAFPFFAFSRPLDGHPVAWVLVGIGLVIAAIGLFFYLRSRRLPDK